MSGIHLHILLSNNHIRCARITGLWSVLIEWGWFQLKWPEAHHGKGATSDCCRCGHVGWASTWSGKAVRCLCDNTVVVAVIRGNQRSGPPNLIYKNIKFLLFITSLPPPPLTSVQIILVPYCCLLCVLSNDMLNLSIYTFS